MLYDCILLICLLLLLQYPSISPSLLGRGETYASFSHRLHKSAHLLAIELFGTQLRQIRGVSAATALTIIQSYPSCAQLIQAFEKESSVEDEERMLEKVERGVGQRPVGKALALKVRTFFRSKDYG